MKAFEKEITIGRNTDWIWNELDTSGYDPGEQEGVVHAYVTVRPSDSIVLSAKEYAQVHPIISENYRNGIYEGKERGRATSDLYTYAFKINDYNEYEFTSKEPIF